MRRLIPEAPLAALLIAGALLLFPGDGFTEPASRGDAAFYRSGIAAVYEKRNSTTSVVAHAVLHFFEKFISPVDNRQCIFYPTCSDYARQAIESHGFARGFTLSTARLIRCNPTAYSKGYYPKAAINEDRYRAYDPVP